ncbi:MAG: OmcA/MtrC family decaheme c-type cytochrome [Acidobacteria bacterium]|nr:OmcA/MtrC family decaheme c-type cytochrome [Acidobacteriota bacterium]
MLMKKSGFVSALAILVGSAWLVSSAPGPNWTVHDKAYYLEPRMVNFVRPGLVLKIVSAEITSDGTMRARVKLTDPKGLPLDREGITTPGAISVSLIAATIPKDQTQYTAYTTRVQTSPITKVTAVQPGTDVGGVFEKLAEGEYQYTFATKAPTNLDRTATHTIGAYSSRNLTEFDLGTQYSNDVFTFVPDGSKVTTVRDIVRTATCNSRCHDPLALHGGARQKVELCVLCHQPQNMDPDTGNTVDFKVMIHKIHRGADLPSVKAGKPYQIIGFNQTVVDFSDVEFPADVRNCEVCHDPKSGAAQADAWLKPNRATCGACHDDVNFATGENHVDLPQVSDNQCSTCHFPEGELEFDASIRGAHTIERFSRDLPGTTFQILAVDDGSAGKRPIVTFTIKDKAGKPIPTSEMNRVSLVLAGPSSDYGGMVPEDASKATGPGDGRYFYTFQNPIAANAKGTFSVGIEGYRNIKLLPGTKKERTVRDAGVNKVFYFSVDGSKVEPRRTVVMVDKCNACHFSLSMHGSNRNQIQHCVQCHNPNQTDAARRPPSELPGETIAFKTMIHRIHTGEDLEIEYTIWGGSPNDFTKIAFPGDRRNCDKCHVNNSQQLPLKDNLLNVVNPRGPLNPMGPTAAACLGCHTSRAVFAHAYSMTTPIGEACATCHGMNAEFSVNRVHAR